ncbi:MAG: class I SAM-dependent methyltransferase, partial [bacterium]
KKGDKVLDIGSGHDPFPLATHLADFYEEETSHRSGKLVKDGRPFVRCSVEKMPFKNKEFDFVYCSHVLEHAKDPAKACDEIMRIGRRGYIETPTRSSDILFNIERGEKHHLWHITAVGNCLIFIEWLDREKRKTTEYFNEQSESIFKNSVQDFVHDNWDLLYNMFLWQEGFNYYVFDKKGNLINHKTI